MQTVFQSLADHARTRPEATAMQSGTTRLSWADLASRVAGLARRLDGAPATIGVDCAAGIDAALADLAVTLTGRRVVPLPGFFSAEQRGHICAAAGIGAVLGDAPRIDALPFLPVSDPADSTPTPLPAYPGGAERVIFTSGSSGRPKGVVIGDRQLSASLAALRDVVAPGPNDRHLSVLPLAQLLEQIAGLFLPILAGAEIHYAPEATQCLFGGAPSALTDAFARIRPTTTVLVPALLARWTADLHARGLTAPDSLRFVATGGAPNAAALLAAAEAAGLPVYEGYGLSECCAVVAMNRPGATRPGTVGPILPMLDVRIEAGEIVVTGPTVMQGYLDGAPAPEAWHTGDLGRIEDGFLIVEGRKDRLIVTPAGRNISPEWVEARLTADPRIPGAALTLAASGDLVLVVVTPAQLSAAEIAAPLADLPAYARPARAVIVPPATPGLLNIGGGLNRLRAAELAETGPAQELTYPQGVAAK